MNRMTVAVTGANGFCGRHVARAVAATGARVIAVGRQPGPVGEHRFWDAASPTGPDLRGVDAVIHLAAAVGDPRPGTDADAFTRVNVDGARRLLAAAADRPLVWVSSASVYDPRLDRSSVDEDHPRAGHLNAYGRTKAIGEAAALDAGAVVLRPHAVYGSGDRHLLPRLLRAVRFGAITLPGNDIRITLTAVENLASACTAGLHWAPGAYNIGDPTPHSRDEVVGWVLSAVRGPTRIRHVPVPVATAAARVIAGTARLIGSEPVITPYSVDQLAHDFVLDLRRARATGWRPVDGMADYLELLMLESFTGRSTARSR
ncbi:NAD-dependent epimerase/dehydratase family protein [Millisia brevis]|uniref:NAD-dependent epimerase/dehydratase family protein n=1 Tax=Millisia brevis TaxID=264148 RepID=UPI00082A7429|nr:NAD(P)-dependent oxidoreductase [Millisia brevis]